MNKLSRLPAIGINISRNRQSVLLSVRHMAQQTGTANTASTVLQRDGKKQPDIINFRDSRPFQQKTFGELVRAWCILKMTSFDVFVRNSEKMLFFARRVLPSILFEKTMEGTFYGHFTAGNTEENSKATVAKLNDAGMKMMMMIPIENVFGNTKSMEDTFKENRQTVLDCVSLIGLVEPNGFSQIKITSLEEIALYRRLNEYLINHETNHQEPGDWNIGRVARLVEKRHFEKITFSDLSSEENKRVQHLFKVVDDICQSGRNQSVRVMIDAEQTYIQAALGYVILVFQAVYNKDECVVFNTYQCYRKDSLDRIKADYELGQKLGFKIAGKFVRGAYLNEERRLAEENGYESPINDTYDATNKKYHDCIDYILPKIENDECSVMVATHNEETVQYTTEQMIAIGITKDNKNLCFGQIYGMCDHVSFTLGQLGYQIFKSVPVGTIDDTLLYLTRRAVDNRLVLHRTKTERSIIRKEVLDKIMRK